MLARLLCLLACLSVAAGFVATPLVSASQLQQSRVATQQIVMAAPTKPMKVNERNRIANKAHKSEMRTRVKRVQESLEVGDYASSSSLLSKAFAILDKNVKRGILHKNTAARKKSQLHLKVKKLEGAAAATSAAPSQ